jgi:uncharacterized protein (TIGR03435 family)
MHKPFIKFGTVLLAFGLSSSFGPLALSQPATPSSSLPTQSSAPMDASYFDVISIHPVDMTKDTSGYGGNYKPGVFRGFQLTPAMLVWAATGVSNPARIKGMPDWATHAKYNIDAKVIKGETPSTAPINDQKAMELSILTSRFHFVSHYETAEIPVFALVVAKGGIKMSTQPPPDAHAPDGFCWRAGHPGYLKSDGCTMSDLAKALNIVDDHQVLDRTGLAGHYYFELDFDHDATSSLINGYRFAVRQTDNATWPSLYQALPDQLGLKLKPIKAPMPILVIDHIEPPTEN